MFGRHNKLDVDWLAKVHFFDGFSPDALDDVASLGQKVEAEGGSELTDQGRFGDVAYVIVEGSANVRMNGEYVANVGPGAVVGEMALIEHRPRTATVTADGSMVLVAFGIAEFRELLERHPSAKNRVYGLLDTRARANDERS